MKKIKDGKMREKKDLVVTLADRNYVQQAKQLFSSVYWNAGWKGDYMLLAHDIPEKELKWFRDKGIIVKKCKPLSDNPIGVIEIRPPVVTSKFYLFAPEFKKWNNILFLEGDIIVKASLDRLTKLNRFYGTDVFDRPKLRNQLAVNNKELYNQIKNRYNLNCRTFNSGVMIFNSDIIKEDSFDKLKSLFNEYKELSNFGEEGIINLFLYKKWKKLPIAYNLWNYSISHSCRINIKDVNGIVLHFISSKFFQNTKPWETDDVFYNEWTENLEKAESIDLSKIQPALEWSGFRIYVYELYLNLRYILFSMMINMAGDFFLTINKIKKYM